MPPWEKYQVEDGPWGGYATPQPAPKDKSLPIPSVRAGMTTWGDVSKSYEAPIQYWTDLFKNVPESAMQFGKDIIQPFLHPIDTATNIYELGKGAVQLMTPGEQPDEAKARAVGKFFADRYGSLENIKSTIKNDPIGSLADASAILSAGGTLAAKAPGTVGKIGKVAKTAGQMTDPLTLAMRGGKMAGRQGLRLLGSIGTHTGSDSLLAAFRAGAKGGDMGSTFVKNMRGQVSPMAVVDDARAALSKMRIDRGRRYLEGMEGVKANTNVIDFAKVQRAVDNVSDVGKYKGVSINRPAAEIWDQLNEAVETWGKLDPTEYHTPAGIDALKQSLGNIRDATQPGTPARKVASDVYRGVRDLITNEAPDYARVMKGYEDASDLIQDIEKTLSLNEKASVDTALRKLQSVMRNNVNTTYGRRAELLKGLEGFAGNEKLSAAIAGQNLNTLAPRGLGGLQAGMTAAGGYIDPRLLAALPLQSPRLMGEATYGMGQASRLLPPEPALRLLGRGAFQAGRLPR